MTSAPKGQAAVYLTFDDGPDPRFTPRILDLLEFFQVRATFFVLGQACERYPELVRRIVDGGHSIGNHTFSHCHPWFIDADRAREEVRRAYENIADVCGTPPRFFRPPHGRLRRCMLEEAQSLGMATILWSRSAIDWGVMADIDSIGRRLGRTRGGDIVLCHDAPREKNRPDLTLAVLPGFIEECQGRQLHFAELDQLFAGPAENGGRSLSPAQPV